MTAAGRRHDVTLADGAGRPGHRRRPKPTGWGQPWGLQRRPLVDRPGGPLGMTRPPSTGTADTLGTTRPVLHTPPPTHPQPGHPARVGRTLGRRRPRRRSSTASTAPTTTTSRVYRKAPR